jgi:hypothetical protein
MKWLLVFSIGAVCGFGAAFYFSLTRANEDSDIIFPDRSSWDPSQRSNNGFFDGFVATNGTLTGDGLPLNKNNAFQVSCYKSHMDCYVFKIEQIGKNQIGDLDWPMVFTISQWKPTLIVATYEGGAASGYPEECIRSTLNIGRGTGYVGPREGSGDPVSVELIEEPINQSSPKCAYTPNVAHKWFLEDPPFWKAIERDRK